MRISPLPGTMTESKYEPIVSHTEVLGVDIMYWQRDKGEMKFRRYGIDATVPDVRKELAFWARRNLFDS